ncbi:beta-ketothiolase BktB [Xanthobacter sp. YC-JY1]|uniref:beta-ketothiolase BktB n=1 Tax=Xanthobacter sp. YC-JY1 TaxID=2419844 RepID=UPI001F26E8CA|nr:beta-ketothiolase BktB [Xanthobacter sp. YC-JY1]UJX44718.1 acetyl-CoA C-acyltransferase [Xanthobacter sp. YC-JY1]
MSGAEVFFVSAARTAIGDFGGSLKDVPATTLGAHAARAAISRSGLAAEEIGQSVVGNVIHGEPRDMYISRVVAMEAGVPKEAPALTVNRLCGSGLQAILTAAHGIMLGDAETALAGGTESMSRAGYLLPGARWGQRMGNAQAADMMVGVLTDPFGHGHMGVTAETVSQRYDVSREAQDAAALESHRRAAHAISAGYFKDEIAPFELSGRKGTVIFDTDEHVRREASLEDFARLRPVFAKGGTVTAGNSSGINDGAGAVVLASREAVAKRGLTPLARLVSWGLAGVDPAEMGMGPVPAVRTALARAGIGVDDLDVIESNEAFAAQSCAVGAALGFDPAKVNPNGGAIALGHPVGATGAILTVKILHELKRIGGKYGLVTMCIGGGQGIAMVVEAA